MRFKFIGSPRLGRLEQISKWLQEERATSDTGFYCNISIISKAFRDREAFCATVNNEAIAFCVFSRHGNTARINIAEVCPSHRGGGAGRFLVEKTLEALAHRKVQVVDLQCEPKESEGFWRHMGFSDIPDGADRNYYPPDNKPIFLYQPTCSSQEEVPFNTVESVIELFDCEPWDCEGRQPKWCWPVIVENGSDILAKPIICPARKDWNIRWKNSGKIVREDKIKYFCSDSCYQGNYLIFNRLKKIENA